MTLHKCKFSCVPVYDHIFKPKCSVNDEKLNENIIRARSRIYELAYCNYWDFFTTFTIDKKNFDRYDLEKYHKSWSQWVRDYNRKYGLKIRYLTIPEKHEDGAWHEHGFISGLPLEHLTAFDIADYLPVYILDKLKAGQQVYNWLPYAQKFGWVDFEPIKNHEAVSKYITKYISKDLTKSVTQQGAHLFYSSKGLNSAIELKRGTTSVNMIPSFENDYVKVLWTDYNTENILKCLSSITA